MMTAKVIRWFSAKLIQGQFYISNYYSYEGTEAVCGQQNGQTGTWPDLESEVKGTKRSGVRTERCPHQRRHRVNMDLFEPPNIQRR